MHRRRGEKRDNWLLIKQHDAAARSKRDKDILEEKPLSVNTGRTLEEIADGKPRRKRRPRQARPQQIDSQDKAKKPRRQPRKRPSGPNADDRPQPSQTQDRQDQGAPAGDARRKRAKAANLRLMREAPAPRHTKKAAEAAHRHGKRAALPHFVKPCLATLVDKAPSSDNWIHEIKFDGYRIQARLEHGKVKLLTRKGLDWTEQVSDRRRGDRQAAAKTALIDGELVSEDKDGISRFSLLQQDLKEGRHDRMVLYAFDLHASRRRRPEAGAARRAQGGAGQTARPRPQARRCCASASR